MYYTHVALTISYHSAYKDYEQTEFMQLQCHLLASFVSEAIVIDTFVSLSLNNQK